MNRRWTTLLRRWPVVACGLVPGMLAACGGGGAVGGGSGVAGGGGGYGGPVPAPGTISAYAATTLVSNGAASAKTTDAALANPWGIVFAPGDLVWTANNASDTSTLYDGSGTKNSLSVAIPPGSHGAAKPTGIVFNPGAGFLVSNGTSAAPAQFIFAGEGGTVTGWAPSVDPTNALPGYDDGAGGAIYKGLALAAAAGSQMRLFAADFHNNKIDGFDASFKKIALPNTAFVDPTLPTGYAPFNIQALDLNGSTLLYVTYAMAQAPANRDPVVGAGRGIVDVYDTQGTFKTHLVGAGGPLNAPWGLTLAPAGFGSFSGALLVGNFGDGWINAYDPVTGAFRGTLSDANGQAIASPGLWGIAFGNGADNQPTSTLFFAAGPDNEADGVYGRIDLTM